MVLELKQVFEIIDEVFEFDYSLDLSDYEIFSTKPFATPVNVKGSVSNRASIVYLEYTISFTLNLNCDRCLDAFSRDFKFTVEQILVTELNTDNDEYIVVEDFKLELDELCLSDILLSLPSKLLCSNDCKGLCQKCGVNLNQHSCLCNQKEIDPRLAVLSQFLDKEEA